MTVASWRLTGVGPTLAMALVRRWLGVGQFLCSLVIVGIFFVFYVSCSQISLHIIENWGFWWAPGLNPDAKPIQCETQVGGGKNQGNKEIGQRLANAMASVGPTPVKHHEAAVMALAGCLMHDHFLPVRSRLAALYGDFYVLLLGANDIWLAVVLDYLS
ncbi:hypothetical protein B0H16DRAFT_1459502 [Mycena metata]|uniref:Uncharacterized protein n=1 Tax=Mycena metata TaxID=1033252 RepID=A0AAD7IYH0_9AGAR|nr:hypothetical protein B0H16DRAFT_1459502 [Mycena metata]